jgi:hypothetical protein
MKELCYYGCDTRNKKERRIREIVQLSVYLKQQKIEVYGGEGKFHPFLTWAIKWW